MIYKHQIGLLIALRLNKFYSDNFPTLNFKSPRVTVSNA